MKRNVFVILLCLLSLSSSAKDFAIIHLSNSQVAVVGDDFEKVWQIDPPLSPLEGRWVHLEYKGALFLKKPFKADVHLIGEAENLAEMLIAEFTTKGSVRNQDVVKLFCIKSGSTQNLSVFYNGNVTTLSDGFVTEGEYLELILSEGVLNNNGYIEVRATPCPYSRIMDKVLYTDDKKRRECYDYAWSGIGVNVSLSSRKKPLVRIKDSKGCYIDTNTASDFTVQGGS